MAAEVIDGYGDPVITVDEYLAYCDGALDAYAGS